MHKKLAADLTSLAHSILQLKNKEDIFVLKQKAYEVYEKLAVLAYVEEYINTTPNATETKEEILRKIENAVVKEVVETQTDEAVEDAIEELLAEEEEEIVVEFVVEETDEHVVIMLEEEEEEEPTLKVVKEIMEQPFDELEKTLFSSDDITKKDEKNTEEKKMVTLEEELEDTISVDVAAGLFEKVTSKKSLNDALQKNLQIGLNDRIAFVKNLFDGSQGDFNRVVSQINSFKTEKEAKKFINKMVKPDYDWSSQEEYEERFISLIERKFA
ncbi:MAG: hypothetical protein JKY44_06150 [Flavobacteriaceae bacterium]|nr:hypothetical protein [Flavobacteriaceae bacterium]